MLANFLGVLPILTSPLCALAFIMCSKSNPLVVFALVSFVWPLTLPLYQTSLIRSLTTLTLSDLMAGSLSSAYSICQQHMTHGSLFLLNFLPLGPGLSLWILFLHFHSSVYVDGFSFSCQYLTTGQPRLLCLFFFPFSVPKTHPYFI
jgi:hypothetical protein